jgi:spore germination protein KC
MKRILIILPILILILLLSGCWDRREVNDIAIILGAAIDKEDNENIELSVQVFIPKALSGGGGMNGGASGGGGMTMVRTANGSSLADAASKLQPIFFGGTRKSLFLVRK